MSSGSLLLHKFCTFLPYDATRLSETQPAVFLSHIFAFTVTYAFSWVKTADTVFGIVEVSWLLGPQLFGIAFHVGGLQQLPGNYAVLLPVCGRCFFVPHRKWPNEEY